jgi:hypothetical protein
VKSPPAGIEVIATLYSLVYVGELSVNLVRGLPHRFLENIAAAIMILVLIFLSRGYDWARWLLLVAQGFRVVFVMFLQITHPQPSVSAVIGHTLGITTAICVMSYLSMAHVRHWFRQEALRRAHLR